MTQRRVYLDWNATAPIRHSARKAMAAAAELVGNPSSVHAEGRAARLLVETARSQLASLCGVDPGQVTFTSGATEAAALALSDCRLHSAAIEHDAVLAWTDPVLDVDSYGRVDVIDPPRSTLQLANSETGLLQDLPAGIRVTDATQALGKIPVAGQIANADVTILSAHKMGGPKGVGAVVLRKGVVLESLLRGGGQEFGRRSGTENLPGIAGFGAAAKEAARDIASGMWDQVRELRNRLEDMLQEAAPETHFFSRTSRRLPNTTCFAVAGWKAETQVIQLDLGGFAVSAGSACSSGKVKSSRALQALGADISLAESAIRVSIGPLTAAGDLARFARVWSDLRRRKLGRRRSLTHASAAQAA